MHTSEVRCDIAGASVLFAHAWVCIEARWVVCVCACVWQNVQWSIYLYIVICMRQTSECASTSVWVFCFGFLAWMLPANFCDFIMRAQFVLFARRGVSYWTLHWLDSWGGKWRLSNKLTTFGCESLSLPHFRKTPDWHIAIHRSLTTNKLLHEWLITFVQISSVSNSVTNTYCIDLLSLTDLILNKDKKQFKSNKPHCLYNTANFNWFIMNVEVSFNSLRRSSGPLAILFPRCSFHVSLGLTCSWS